VRCASSDACPAASRAATPNVYAVPQSSPVCEADVESTLATFAPFRNTSYAVTPTSSVDASHFKSSPVCVMFDELSPVGVDGAFVSPAGGEGGGGQTSVVADAGAAVERLPAASNASTVRR
jgi:hypothetical protein